MARYRFDYAEGSPYGHAVALLREHRHPAGRVVLDLGCGYGAIAEPVRRLGLDYVGLDLDEESLADLRARGFEARPLDLADPGGIVATLQAAAAGREVAAIAALDVVEHLTDGPATLRALNDFALASGRPPLVVSVPNVTHVDLVAKLLLGRWDVTETGLLDSTHVSLYSPARLRRVFEGTGWAEIAARDFELEESDQHFPPDAASLAAGAPLHELVAFVRGRAESGATTNQFVRAFAPVPLPDPTAGQPVAGGGAAEQGVLVAPETGASAPLLSLLLVTAAGREALLADALLALDAQTCQDFEVVVLVLDALGAEVRATQRLVSEFGESLAGRTQVAGVRGASRPRALSLGVARARGRYVTVLDDEVLPFAHLVETYASLSAGSAGRVLRVLPAEQAARPVAWPDGHEGFVAVEGARTPWPASFDLLAELCDELSPPESYALPRSCFADLGIVHEESLGASAEWHALVQAALCCGVACAEGEPATLRRAGALGPLPGAPTPGEVARARARARARLDETPLLLPPGSARTIRELLARAGTGATLADRPAGGPAGPLGR